MQNETKYKVKRLKRWNYSKGRRRASCPSIQSKHSSLTLTIKTTKEVIIIMIEKRHTQLIATTERLSECWNMKRKTYQGN